MVLHYSKLNTQSSCESFEVFLWQIILFMKAAISMKMFRLEKTRKSGIFVMCSEAPSSARGLFINDITTARGEVVQIIGDKSIMMIDVSCYNQANAMLVGSMSKVKLLDIEE
ncbi:MAG: hypothetical protein WC231_00170 [Dehalococcoidales bacterium]